MIAAATKPLIGYLRVSTSEVNGQGINGLGIQSQRYAIEQYSLQSGRPIAVWFSEVGSGGDDHRPELAKALAEAKRIGGTICVKSSCRLARKLAKVAAVVEDTNVLITEMPNISIEMLQVSAMMDESIRRNISQKTSAALQVLKRQGVPLGANSHRGPAKSQVGIPKPRRESYPAELVGLILSLRKGGATMESIASTLREAGYKTIRGAEFSKTTVQKIIERSQRGC